MGLRYRKSVKIAPGTKLNLGKTGVGVSAGTKGAHVSMNSSGRVSTSAGVPGSGLSYTTSSGGTKKKTGCLIPTIIFLVIFGFIIQGFSSCLSNNSKSQPPVSSGVSFGSSANGRDVVTTVVPSDPNAAALRTQALEEIQELLTDQGYKVVEAKKSSDSLIFCVNLDGISDEDDLSAAPDNWEEVKSSLASSAEEIIQTVSDLYNGKIVIYLQDSGGNNLLTCLNKTVTYDKFRVEKDQSESSGQHSGERYVWVTSSGKKYHNSSTCSNMKNPKSIPISEATLKGYTACDKCA